jgi:hypothetical protein
VTSGAEDTSILYRKLRKGRGFVEFVEAGSRESEADGWGSGNGGTWVGKEVHTELSQCNIVFVLCLSEYSKMVERPS